MAATTHRQYGTLAWLKPGALDRASLDVFAMTPPDVNLSVFTSTAAVSMMEAARFDAEAFDRTQRPAILESVRGLTAYAHPAFTSVTGDLIQSAMGVKWDRALRDEISEITGTPAATAMTGTTDALTFLGARRVSVASPFRDEQNAYIRRYLEDAGFELAAISGYPTHGIRDVKALPEDAPLTLGTQVFAADRSAQALIVACPIWAVSPYIAKLEEACGVPVLTVLNTMLWAGLHTLGHPGGVRGYGRLLEHPLERSLVATR